MPEDKILAAQYVEWVNRALADLQAGCAGFIANPNYETLKLLDRSHHFCPKCGRAPTGDELECAGKVYVQYAKMLEKLRSKLRVKEAEATPLAYSEYTRYVRQAFLDTVTDYSKDTPPSEKAATEALLMKTLPASDIFPELAGAREAAHHIIGADTDIPAFIVTLHDSMSQRCIGDISSSVVFGSALWLQEGARAAGQAGRGR